MPVSKQQPIAETFNPKKRSPRHQQTERAFQMAVRNHLLSLLMVMNPQDQIHYGAMSYSDLVVYARDWLQTEVEEVGPAVNIREEKTAEERVRARVGLDLD